MRPRRRSYNKRPEPVRRKDPVIIECIGNVDGPVSVVIGNETYLFGEGRGGRREAPVYIEDHIECFLARPEMYRAAGGHYR